MTTLLFVGLSVAAFATSAVSAVLGMAGGISLLAVMTLTLPPSAVVPIHGVVQLGSNATRTVVFLRDVSWPLFARFAPGFVVGILSVVPLWSAARFEFLRGLIGLFLWFFVYSRRRGLAVRNAPLWSYTVLGLVVGWAAIFVGATGPILAPFFLRDDLRKESIIATKAVCQAWAHLWKIPAFLALSFSYRAHLPLLLALSVAVFLGTLAGRRFLLRMSRKGFVRAFEWALVVVGGVLVGQGILAAAA